MTKLVTHKSTSQGGLYGNYCYFHAELNISGLRQKFDWLIIGRDYGCKGI